MFYLCRSFCRCCYSLYVLGVRESKFIVVVYALLSTGDRLMVKADSEKGDWPSICFLLYTCFGSSLIWRFTDCLLLLDDLPFAFLRIPFVTGVTIFCCSGGCLCSCIRGGLRSCRLSCRLSDLPINSSNCFISSLKPPDMSFLAP